MFLDIIFLFIGFYTQMHTMFTKTWKV